MRDILTRGARHAVPVLLAELFLVVAVMVLVPGIGAVLIFVLEVDPVAVATLAFLGAVPIAVWGFVRWNRWQEHRHAKRQVAIMDQVGQLRVDFETHMVNDHGREVDPMETLEAMLEDYLRLKREDIERRADRSR